MANGGIIEKKGKVNTLGQMATSMMGNGKMIKEMGKVF